jgi:hypothetical protein
VNLYSTTLLEEAETIRIILQDTGVDASIDNYGGAMYAVGIPTSASPFRIMIPDNQSALAKSILEEHFRDRNKSKEENPKLEESRATSRRLWLIAWLAPPALTLSFSPLMARSMEALMMGGAYFLGIGLLAWKLGAFGPGKKSDQ